MIQYLLMYKQLHARLGCSCSSFWQAPDHDNSSVFGIDTGKNNNDHDILPHVQTFRITYLAQQTQTENTSCLSSVGILTNRHPIAFPTPLLCQSCMNPLDTQMFLQRYFFCALSPRPYNQARECRHMTRRMMTGQQGATRMFLDVVLCCGKCMSRSLCTQVQQSSATEMRDCPSAGSVAPRIRTRLLNVTTTRTPTWDEEIVFPLMTTIGVVAAMRQQFGNTL